MGFADCGLRTVPNTRAPRSASNCAISRPMPEETPVTNVALFFNNVCIYTYNNWLFAFRLFRVVCLLVQGFRHSCEIRQDCRPTFFTKSFYRGALGGLPSWGELLDLFSAFGRD